MIRILHFADLHLDSPFSLRSVREAERRRTELRSDLSSIMMYIRAQKVDICLIAGDLFDGESVTPETRVLLERELSSCPSCRFFISPGNHDPLTEGSPYKVMNLPENVHVFSPQKSAVRLDDLGVDVYGFAFDGKNDRNNPLKGYPALDETRINLLCCHGDLDGGAESPYGAFTRADIASSGFDYVALGHIHKGTGLQCENGVYWAYPGCVEGRGFDETGEKGVLFGALEKGNAAMKFIRIAKRRYEIVPVDVTGMERMQALETMRETARHYGEDTVLRFVLGGETKKGFVFLPEEFEGAGYPQSVELVDQTVLAPDFTELEQNGTLAGVFYRLMRDKIARGEASEDALKYGLLALEDRNVADFGTEV